MMPRRGRRAERQAVADATPRTRNYRRLRHPFAPQSVLSAYTIIGIHATALRVLSELGVRIFLPEARDLFRKNNALVDDDEMIRIGAGLVEQARFKQRRVLFACVPHPPSANRRSNRAQCCSWPASDARMRPIWNAAGDRVRCLFGSATTR